MGDNPDTDQAISALQEAAANCRATLTSNDVAMTRAANAAKRLDDFMAIDARHGRASRI
jgi:hypothetical protein